MSRAKNQRMRNVKMLYTSIISKPSFRPARIRSYFLAPRFCPQ